MSFKQEMIKLKNKTKMEKRIEDRIYLDHQIDSIKNDIRHKIVKNPNKVKTEERQSRFNDLTFVTI